MRYAICNEMFEGWEPERIFNYVAELGYTGVEFAPFTLAESPTAVPSERRSEISQQASAAGIEITGLHWLLAKTEGCYLTSPDADVRRTHVARQVAEREEAQRQLVGEVGAFARRELDQGGIRPPIAALGRTDAFRAQ